MAASLTQWSLGMAFLLQLPGQVTSVLASVGGGSVHNQIESGYQAQDPQPTPEPVAAIASASAASAHRTSCRRPYKYVLRQDYRPVTVLADLRQQLHQTLYTLQQAAAGTVQKTASSLSQATAQAGHKRRLNPGAFRRIRLPWKRAKRAPAQRQGPGGFFGFGSPDAAAKHLIKKALAAEKAMDIRAAVAAFEEHGIDSRVPAATNASCALLHVNKLLPGNAYWLAMLAKEVSDCTYLDFAPAREQLDNVARCSFNSRAMKLALEAKAFDPSLALPHIAACVSMGRLALLSDNRTKVQLAHDARLHAVEALHLEPNNDLAHHLMGRWHYEMASLNMVVRTLVRVVYGTALAPGTFQEALDSFQEATRLSPKRLVHRVELGRCYERLGQREMAVKQLEAALQLEVEDINAHLQRMDGIQLLQRLQRRRGWGFDPFGSQQGEQRLAAAATAQPSDGDKHAAGSGTPLQ